MRTLPLAETADAFEQVGSGHSRGEIGVTP